MNRDEMLERIKLGPDQWDFIIIGGGATGLGAAIEAASRGFETLLLEQGDFAQGTSSRSTKLIHGGVRYLQQGNVALVLDALKERGLLRQNAPHLVHNLPFVVPNYDWWEGPFYGVGLKLYDMLAGKHGFGTSRVLSKEKTMEYLPTIESQGLRGGVIYYDGQFDDARLAVNMAQTADEQGGTLINYMRVEALVNRGGYMRGVVARDLETGEQYELTAKGIINATGVYTDSIRRMDDPAAEAMIAPSQGVHIVLDQSFLPGDTAVMVPHTDDGRVLFATPWHNRVIVGTTDTLVEDIPLEPKPMEAGTRFLDFPCGQISDQRSQTGGCVKRLCRIAPVGQHGRWTEHGSHIARSYDPYRPQRLGHHYRWQMDDVSQNGRGYRRPGHDCGAA